MKKTLSLALFWPLFSFSIICQAAQLTRIFVVEPQQSGGSSSGGFSIQPDQQILPGTPSYLGDKDGYAEFILSPDDKLHRPRGYGLKRFFIESISWQLIYATHFLVAYGLVMTTHDVGLKAKPYSWISAEAFVAVDLLLKSYWNPDSSLFNPMDQLEASQSDPFKITSMMLSGQSQKQNGQQKSQPTVSSGQQASGATSNQLTGFFTSPPDSGSGGEDEGPDQHQHTLGLNCHVDSCDGVCKLRPSSDSSDSAEAALGFDNSEPHARRSPIKTDPGNGCNYRQSLTAKGVAAIAVDLTEGLTCHLQVLGVDGQKRSCGVVCKSLIAVRDHVEDHEFRRYHCLESINRMRMRRACYYPEPHPCDETVVGADGKEHPCGEVLPNAKFLSCHKLKFHTGPQTCQETETLEDGLQYPCRLACENALDLARHKNAYHKSRKCFKIVVCDNGHLHSCGQVIADFPKQLLHDRMHREGKSFYVQ